MLGAIVGLFAGLLLITLSGYYQGRLRKRFTIGPWPIDKVVGLVFLVGFFVVHRYAPIYEAFPLIISAAGLGAFYHTYGAGLGARDREPEMILVIPPEFPKEGRL